MVTVWENLPGEVVEAETLWVFKTRLDTVFEAIYLLAKLSIVYTSIHLSSSAYPRSGHRGSSSSRVSQTSLFPATSASSDWGIQRHSQASVEI